MIVSSHPLHCRTATRRAKCSALACRAAHRRRAHQFPWSRLCYRGWPGCFGLPNKGTSNPITWTETRFSSQFFIELISESPLFLLVEHCKGHTSISHDNSAGLQEEKPCPSAVDFSRDW